MIIKDMQINNNRIKEAKLNGNIVYQLDIKAPKLSYIHIESSSNSEDAYPNDIIKITMNSKLRRRYYESYWNDHIGNR